MAYNFKKKVQGTDVVDYGVPYDYASIMHYPWTAFSKNGKMTMEPIRSLNGKTPYVKLSDDDALQARRMYKCSSRKYLQNAVVRRCKLICQRDLLIQKLGRQTTAIDIFVRGCFASNLISFINKV